MPKLDFGRSRFPKPGPWRFLIRSPPTAASKQKAPAGAGGRTEAGAFDLRDDTAYAKLNPATTDATRGRREGCLTYNILNCDARGFELDTKSSNRQELFFGTYLLNCSRLLDHPVGNYARKSNLCPESACQREKASSHPRRVGALCRANTVRSAASSVRRSALSSTRTVLFSIVLAVSASFCVLF
jgi:hypothetical protein